MATRIKYWCRNSLRINREKGPVRSSKLEGVMKFRERLPHQNNHSIYTPQNDPNLLAEPRLTQFLTNHGCFHSYLHKRKKAPTPLCSCPEKAEQTAQHLLTECNQFTKERQAVFRKLPLPLIMQHHINTAEVSRQFKNIYRMLQEQSKTD